MMHEFAANNSTLIDGHAHFHRPFCLQTWLDGARTNFEQFGAARGVVLLGHIGSGSSFTCIQEQLKTVHGTWRHEQPDPSSLVLENRTGNQIVVIAGRQIITEEKLELLVFCTDKEVPSGIPLAESIGRANQDESVAVIPWGFGKWWFQRGKVLRNLLETGIDSPWLIGDNGCRIDAPQPPLLKSALEHGIVCLAGSDPLPISSHGSRVGSFGSIVPGNIDIDNPTTWVRRNLRAPKSNFEKFGRCRAKLQFVMDQIGIRVSPTR